MTPTRTTGNKPRSAGEPVPNPEGNPKGAKSSWEPVRKAESPSLLWAQRRRSQAPSGPSWASPAEPAPPGGGSGAPLIRSCLFPSLQNQNRSPAVWHHQSQDGSGEKGPRCGIPSKLPAQAEPSRSTWHGIASRRFWNIFTQGDSTVSVGSSPQPSILHPLWDVGHGRPPLSPPSRHIPLPRMMQPAAIGMRRPPPSPPLPSAPHPRDPDAAQDTAAVGMVGTVTVRMVRMIRVMRMMRRRRRMKMRRMRGV